ITKILTKHQLNTLHNQKTLTTLLIPSNIDDNQENTIAKGIITLHQSRIINKTINKKMKHTAAETVLHKISKAIHKQIWITRYQTTSQDQNTSNLQPSNCTTSIKSTQLTTTTPNNTDAYTYTSINYKSLQVKKRIKITKLF